MQDFGENVERVAGETKWSFWKLFRYAIEGIVSFTTAPLRIAMIVGFLTSLGAFIYLLYYFIHALIYQTWEKAAGYPSLLSFMLFLGGIGGGIQNLVLALGLAGGAAGALTILLDVIVLFLLCVVLTAVAISFVHAVTARLKIEQIFKYYWTVVSALALISLVLAWYGL